MKTKSLLNLFLVTVFLFIIGSCDKDKVKEKELSPEDAKVELRNASQEIATNMDQMMNTPAMLTVSFLADLMDNSDWKTTLKTLVFESGKPNLTAVKNAFSKTTEGSLRNKSIEDYGVYEYNFLTEDFDLIEASASLLKLYFPSDQTAYGAGQNNAEFLANDLEYTTFTYTDEYWDEYSQSWITETYEETIPTKVNISLKINEIPQMTASYNSTLSENGFPTLVTASMNMAPYQFEMSLTGSGVNYTTNLTFKQDNLIMMAYNWILIYSVDMSEVEKATGDYYVNPLKVEGFMNYAAIDNYMLQIEESGGDYDLDYLNSQLSMELLHVGLNAKIGDLEFRLYTDPEYGDVYPMIAVAYTDGTYEWIENIMDDGSYKFRRIRK
ncbi:MAG: hypothetical protein CVT92_05835 [Bacteroidetes bacterium HGW-Bacteroidetes-1]|nr:MAG: hypothetical protein CVT92_05835 [Bacteroidetes bacterium HGW-Bacteroidetes-1]